ncbi:hypothetical protein BGZ96_004115, partial [Linnemannia gamsii]
MTKSTLLTPPGSPPQPTSQQDPSNCGQDNENQSVSPQRIRKRDRFIKMFRSSSSKPKATSSQSASSKSTAKDDSTACALHLSPVGSPESVEIEHVVSSTAVESTPFETRPLSPLTRPRLDVFPQNVRAPTVCITLPTFGARIETTPQLALCIDLLSKASDNVDRQDGPFKD